MIEGILESSDMVGMNFFELKKIESLLEDQIHDKLHTGVRKDGNEHRSW